ncbi:hypothetical protein [Crateriforma conspicua]|uniref:Uncharacterized protein n=1 Tax=Crateriforma conspicua TaxID=2527996 RepID=A0A5C6FME1_9PLAN|nr:hypothetical protein [Crateriforma conspicua]TWU61726.1 hypothetical protein V7x_34140 [Crateriforma conspicua]
MLIIFVMAIWFFIIRRDFFFVGHTRIVENVVHDTEHELSFAYGMVGSNAEMPVKQAPAFGYIVVESSGHRFDTNDRFDRLGKAFYFCGRKFDRDADGFTLAIKKDGQLVFFEKVTKQSVKGVFEWDIGTTDEGYAQILRRFVEELELEGVSSPVTHGQSTLNSIQHIFSVLGSSANLERYCRKLCS